MSPVLVFLTASIPAVVAWWTGRRLKPLRDDPALPEMLLARQQRLMGVSAAGLAVMIVLGGTNMIWGVPLLALALLAGGYPLRQVLLGETAGFPIYLWRAARSLVGSLGFWAVLVLSPTIVLATSSRALPIALALIVVLMVWDHLNTRVWLRLHDAVPLTSDELTPRFETIVERAGMTAPEVYRVGAPGARFVNAIALPSVKRPAIGLGTGLLELLEPDEVAAIYAHELAHIEQFSPRVLRRMRFITHVMIVLATVLPLAALQRLPDHASWLTVIWPAIVLMVLVLRGARSQQRETESDLRAAALCGDADAVVRGLIKVHLHSFTPRRWPVDMERGASHPSLARRIQALRTGGDLAISSLGAPAVIATDREGSFVMFEDDRAWWFDGVPTCTALDAESLRRSASTVRSVVWSELVELRVATKGEHRSLIAAHRNGERWAVPLPGATVAEVQNVLDRVDVRLHPTPGEGTLRRPQLLTAVVVLAMISVGPLGILLLPALVLAFRPSSAAITAVGAMALGRAAIALVLGGESWLGDLSEIGFVLSGLIGAIALVLTRRYLLRGGVRDGMRLTLGVLGAAGAILIAVIIAAVRSLPADQVAGTTLMLALAVTLLAAGAVLVMDGSRRARWVGAATVVAAALAGSAAVRAALEDAGSHVLAQTTAHALEIARVEVDESATGLRLSPNGSRFIVQRPVEGSRTAPSLAPSMVHVVGAPGGARQRDIVAAQVEFLNDDQVLVLLAVAEQLELRLERADSAAAIWTSPLPVLYGPKLVVSPSDGTWAVIGDDAVTDSLMVLSGTAASPQARAQRFAPLDSMTALDFLVFDGGARLIVPVFDTQVVSSSLLLALAMMGDLTQHVELWEVTPGHRRRMGALHGLSQCGTPDDGVALCTVRRRSRTQIWAVRATGESVPLGSVPLADAWIEAVGPGRRLTVARNDVVADVDVAGGRVARVRLPSGSASVSEVRGAPGRLAVLQYDTAGMQVVFFALDGVS